MWKLGAVLLSQFQNIPVQMNYSEPYCIKVLHKRAMHACVFLATSSIKAVPLEPLPHSALKLDFVKLISCSYNVHTNPPTPQQIFMVHPFTFNSYNSVVIL